jgi:HSP20 family molecular chaperone IbpA
MYDLDVIKTPWDVLFKDMFNTVNTSFSTLENKMSQPIDIYEADNKLVFEIACVGAEKKDISIKTQGDILRIQYNKPEVVKEKNNKKAYYYRGVKRSTFDFSYKVTNRFNLKAATSSLDKGILKIEIPVVQKKEDESQEIEIR